MPIPERLFQLSVEAHDYVSLLFYCVLVCRRSFLRDGWRTQLTLSSRYTAPSRVYKVNVLKYYLFCGQSCSGFPSQPFAGKILLPDWICQFNHIVFFHHDTVSCTFLIIFNSFIFAWNALWLHSPPYLPLVLINPLFFYLDPLLTYCLHISLFLSVFPSPSEGSHRSSVFRLQQSYHTQVKKILQHSSSYVGSHFFSTLSSAMFLGPQSKGHACTILWWVLICHLLSLL